MACRGCSSSNQRRSGGYGCRKAVQSSPNYAVYYASSLGSYTPCGSCVNPCGSCVNPCSDCMNPCGGCSGSCIMPRSTSDAGISAAHSVSSPYYLGPCGPVNPISGCTANCSLGCGSCMCCQSGCQHNCQHNCQSGCQHSCHHSCCHNQCCSDAGMGGSSAIYGYFTQNGSLCAAAGEPIPFNGSAFANGIVRSGGAFALQQGGAYMITLSVTIPANTTLSADFVTLIDDGIAAGGTVIVNKTQIGEPLQVQAQTVVSAAAGAVIRVVPSENVNITACNQIVSLTIVKVG